MKPIWGFRVFAFDVEIKMSAERRRRERLTTIRTMLVLRGLGDSFVVHGLGRVGLVKTDLSGQN